MSAEWYCEKHRLSLLGNCGACAVENSVHQECFDMIASLRAENARLRGALELIISKCNCEYDHGAETWCDHVDLAKSALNAGTDSLAGEEK